MNQKCCQIFSLLFILIIVSPFAMAEAKAHAYVTLTIINKNPEIVSLKIEPKMFYEDSQVTCIAEVDDEQPDRVKTIYAWYVNDEFVQRSSTFSGFSENDKVTCKAIAFDSAEQMSKEAIFSGFVQQTPSKAQNAKFLGMIAGTEINTEKALKLEEQGIMAITGYTVSNSSYVNEGGIVVILIVVAMLATLFNIRHYLKRRIKNPRPKGQDF